MIDYLELLFLSEEEKQPGGEEIPAPPGRKVESEPVEFRTAPMTEGEEAREISTKPLVDVEAFEPNRAGLPPEPVTETGVGFVLPAANRQGRSDGAEELERRLRRDSRRYDSGFYRY